MDAMKRITIFGYLVKYSDRREPNPSAIHEDVCTLGKDVVDAISCMGLNVAHLISARYERSGYHVDKVEQITRIHTVPIDLRKLWDVAEPSAAMENKEAATV